MSTRSMDDLVQAMGGTGISKSQVSRLCEEIDERGDAFLTRPIEGKWPFGRNRLPRSLFFSASAHGSARSLSRSARGGGVSVAVTIAVGVNTDGRRDVLGMAIGASEAEPFWTELSHAILAAAASPA